MKKNLLTFHLMLLCSFALVAQTPKTIYKLSGNANDGSGNAHHGVATDVTYATDKGGSPNSAGVFNGTSSRIVISDTSTFNVGAGSFSLAFWFKTSNTSKNYMVPFATGMQGFKSGIAAALCYNLLGDVTFGAGAPNPSLPILGDPANSVLIATSATSFNDNNWHFAVMIMDRSANQARILIDNVQQEIVKVNVFGTTGGTLSTDNKYLDITGVKYNTTPTDIAMIGSSASPSINQTFDGTLDEMQFFDVALTNTQAGNLFNGGATGLVKNNQTAGFTVWPTKVDQYLNVAAQGHVFNFEILSLDGREISKGTASENLKLDVQSLQSGIYWLMIKDAHESALVRFIKE